NKAHDQCLTVMTTNLGGRSSNLFGRASNSSSPYFLGITRQLNGFVLPQWYQAVGSSDASWDGSDQERTRPLPMCAARCRSSSKQASSSRPQSLLQKIPARACQTV